jgi:hypothetical protein
MSEERVIAIKESDEDIIIIFKKTNIDPPKIEAEPLKGEAEPLKGEADPPKVKTRKAYSPRQDRVYKSSEAMRATAKKWYEKHKEERKQKYRANPEEKRRKTLERYYMNKYGNLDRMGKRCV